MATIHAIQADGSVLSGLVVFRKAYQLIGISGSTPPRRSLADTIYGFWARWRLRLTGRPDLDQPCKERCRLA